MKPKTRRLIVFLQKQVLAQHHDKTCLSVNVSSKTIDYRIQQALKTLRKELKDYLPLLLLLGF